jgi:hypothetical protein
MTRPFEIATVCTDAYLPAALVCLSSFAATFRGFSSHPLTVFSSPAIAPLSEVSRDAIAALAPHVRFETVDRPQYRDAACPCAEHRAALLTLEVFRPGIARRALFLDMDTLCLGDGSTMLDVEHDFVACPAQAAVSLRNGIETWRAVNTGVFTVGERWRNDDVFATLLAGIEHRHDVNFADQSVINACFAGETVHLLPDTYNFRHWGGVNRAGTPMGSDGLFRTLRPQIKVIHYSGYMSRAKPWAADADTGLAAVQAWREHARRLMRTHPDLAAHFAAMEPGRDALLSGT